MSADGGSQPAGATHSAGKTAAPELPTFRELVKQLVLVRKMSQSDLIQCIREVLVEEADALPKVQVAYCDTHGGWGVSKQFEGYLEETAVDLGGDNFYKERVVVAKHLAPFGRQCSAAHPDIAAALQTYHHYDLGAVFSDLFQLDLAVSAASTAADNLALVCNLDDTPDNFGSKEKPSRYLVTGGRLTAKDIKDYTRVSCIVACVSALRENCQDAKRIRRKLLGRPGIGPGVLHLMIESSAFKYPEEVENARRPYHLRETFTEVGGYRMPYADAVERFKGSTKQWVMWECQEYCKERAMRFLTRHPGVLPPPPSPPLAPSTSAGGDCGDTDLSMGLLFASTAYCKIKIAAVPQIVDWKITEYDGLEAVKIV